MSTTDASVRKRTKDKKRKRGSLDDSNTIIRNKQHENLYKNLPVEEKIHVLKDVKVGGSLISKLVFVLFLTLLGVAVFFILIRSDRNEAGEDGLSTWVTRILNYDHFGDENEEESSFFAVQQVLKTYSDYLYALLPLTDVGAKNLEDGKKDDGNSENLGDTDDDNELGENESEKYSHDFQSYHENKNEDDDDDDGDDNEDDKYSSKYSINFKKIGESANNLHKLYQNDENDDDEEDDDDVTKREYPHLKTDEFSYIDGDDEVEEQEDNNRDFKNDGTLNDEDSDEDDEDDEDRERQDANYEYKDKKQKEEDQEEEENEEEEKKSAGNAIKESSENEDKEIENEDEAKTSNVITKLGVGVALIFVAYTVIIKKWTNYETQDNFNYEHDLHEAENQSSQYSDMFTDSESEDMQEDVQWTTSAPNAEVSDSAPSGTEESDGEINSVSATDHETPHEYHKANITNPYDWQYRGDLDDADEDFDHGRLYIALEKYRKILRSRDISARARYGIAKVLDRKADLQKSNTILTDAINSYEEVLRTPDVPDLLLKIVAERAVNRMRFKGEYDRSVTIQNVLIDRFPNEITHRNDLVVTLLMLNRISEAKAQVEKTLTKWPDNGLAAAHYGFVLKLEGGNLSKAVEFLRKGIQSLEPGTQDSRFYFHLGDALQKLKRNKEALDFYEDGVAKGLFLSKFQRSLYNVGKLVARPWWSLEQTTYATFFKTLEINWKIIRDEVLQLLKNGKKSVFREESEQLREVGDWRQLELFNRGMRMPQCDMTPFTCQTISSFKPAAGCRRGQIKFSIMEPGTHVWPHCGPTNCRLRAHLGLIIPANIFIRVADETRTWQEGKVIVFDDSFEHEVWHNGTSYRLILIVDVWHPDLSEYERKTLSPI